MLTHNLKKTEVAMDVSKYRFSDQEIELLYQYRDNQDDARLKARFIALLMLAVGIEINKVASIIGKSIKTIENWHQQYITTVRQRLNILALIILIPTRLFILPEKKTAMQIASLSTLN